MPLYVELVAPDRSVWSGEADMIMARTTEGELGIMPGHTPLLGELAPGPVRIRRPGEEDLVAAVYGGFLSVSPQGVTVLAESVSLAAEIDTTRARERLTQAQAAAPDDEEAAAAAQQATAELRTAGERV